MAHPIENILRTTMEQLKLIADVNTVVGAPIMTSDNTIVLPVCKISFGFISGGGGKPSRVLRALYRSLRVERLAFCWRVGVRDAPALTALCCGALEQVGDLVRSMLFGKTVFCRAQIRAIPVFDTDQLRLDARGIASCVPAQIIAALLSEGKE